MPRCIVKIFGERNTGTRALGEMLRSGTHITQKIPASKAPALCTNQEQLLKAIDLYYRGDWRKIYRNAVRGSNHHFSHPARIWKHSAPVWCQEFIAYRVHVIFLVKNPYAWAISLARRPYHILGPRTADFACFLSRPWLTERRDNTENVLPSPIGLWNQKLSAYQKFADVAWSYDLNPYFMRFEDFVANPMQELEQALAQFGIHSEGVQPVTKSTKDKKRVLSEIQRYYRTERWRKRLTSRTVSIINERVDWKIAGRFAYKKLDPDDFPAVLPAQEQTKFSHEMLRLDNRQVCLNRKAGATAAA